MVTTEKKPYLKLGLDIGIGSCGFALIDTENCKILEMGVRLWDVPQVPKTKQSTAAARRQARSARRNTKRTADRKKACLKALIEQGLVPESADAGWIQTTKQDKPTLKLRAQGLDRKLTNREWSQVLYSICGRRGYIPHGEGSDADAEGKAVISATKANQQRLEDECWRTIGEMLAHSERSRNRADDYSNCITNALLVEEVHALFEAQRNHGSIHASTSFEEQYLAILTWQKDVSDTDARNYRAVGACTYYPEEKRAADSCLSSEMCRAYERLGHFTWIDENGKTCHLPADIRQRAFDILFSPAPIPKNKDCKVTYRTIRTWIDLDSDIPIKGVDAEKEKTEEIYAPKVWRLLRKNLPAELTQELRNDRELADAVCSAVTYASSENSLRAQLDTLELSDDDISALCQLPFSSKLFSGYGSRSLKALNLLIDSFEDFENVCTLSDAEYACGLQTMRIHGNIASSTQLPPYLSFDETCKNPVVLRVMGQVRKVVNAICKEYGVPDEIHLELARELKQSKKERDMIDKRNRDTKNHRDALRAKLAEELHCEADLVPGKLIRKFEMREEQQEVCPYCGKPIEYERLLREDHYCEIDHILPFSRTCDDAQSNKVLVHQGCNQEKRERTPFEWYEAAGLDWGRFCLAVRRNPRFSRAKQNKLMNTDLSEEKQSEFINRNLNDTRYASRAAKSYIERYLAFPAPEKNNVLAVAGGATAILRDAWGLRKDRSEDNLHHAVDAAVIAACDHSLIKKVAWVSEHKHQIRKDKRPGMFAETEPWEGFAAEVESRKEQIIPTRKAEHGVAGSLFEDTLYRFVGYNEKGTQGILLAKQKLKPSSNYVLHEDGSASIVDSLAFVRLWWDPTVKVRGHKEPGQFLVEPVYCADIPSLDKVDYRPKYIPPQTSKKPRELWSEVPDCALQKPLIVFPGDALLVNGDIRRFHTVNIANCSWEIHDPQGKLTPAEATKGHTIGSLEQFSAIKLISEDVLGHCFDQFFESNSQSEE